MSITGKWFGFGRNADYDEGLRQYDRAQYQEAIAAFSMCLSTSADPTTLRLARFYLGESHVRLAEKFLGDRKFSPAVQALEGALELQPNYPDNHFRLAVACGLAGDKAREAECVSRALELNPNYAEAILLSGVLDLETGQSEAGWKKVERAQELDPSLGGLAIESARASVEKGDASHAAIHLRSVIGAHKNDANHYAQLGSDFLRNRKFEEAAAEFEIALGMAPGYADVRCKYGQALMELDRVPEAEGQFRKALEMNPKYVEAWAQLGISLRRQNRDSEAKEAFRKAIQLDPLHVIASEEVARLN